MTSTTHPMSGQALRTALFGLVGSIVIVTLGFTAFIKSIVPSVQPWMATASVVAIPVSIVYVVGGLPAHFLLHRSGRRRLLHYAVAGAIVGIGVSVVMGARPFGIVELVRSTVLSVGSSGIHAGIGAICGVVFWVLAVWRRDQRPTSGADPRGTATI